MPPIPYWKRPERWLAFFLTFLGVCSFLAIVPANPSRGDLDVEGAPERAEELVQPSSWIDNLRDGTEGARMPGHWTAMMPPLLAVMVAAYFRSMVFALLSAFVTGAFLTFGMNPVTSLFLALHDFIWLQLKQSFSLYTFAFLFLLVGMVHVMSRNGGLGGLVDKLALVARGPRRARMSVLLAGLLVFFDDYANTVVVGSTMQKLTDKWRISREKLAYLVDSTTAPVAGLAVLSTWVAFEAMIFGKQADLLGLEQSGYEMVLDMLPLRFYCIGTIIFLFMSTAMARDFGPMWAAEHRAATQGKTVGDDHVKLGIQPSQSMEPAPNTPQRWYNGLLPVLVVIGCIVLGILWLGRSRLEAEGTSVSLGGLQDWQKIFAAATQGDAGAMPILFWGSVAGGVVAIFMTLGQRLMTFQDTARSYVKGMPTMWMAIFILVMTWSMQEICESLETADYLIALLGDSIALWALPFFTFIIASLISFSTGTSWGTMGILAPVILPLAYRMGAYQTGYDVVFFLTAAAILDGAIFGDHCSPISDTTVLTSISTGCDHIAHVNTQLLYAVTTMALSALFGYLAVACDMPTWLFYVLFPFAAFVVIILVGRPTPRYAPEGG